MTDFLARLKQRKLVQWALAYIAGAWALLQVLDLAAGSYHWPDVVMHAAFGVLALGLAITLLLAWYHGERGQQRVTGVELLLLAGVFAIGGFLIWHYAGTGSLTAKTIAKPVPVAAASAAKPKPIPASSIPAKSIAVLPFENLSADKDNAYFADGMQDLILTKLADIGELKVISRTSTMKYASQPDDLKQVSGRTRRRHHPGGQRAEGRERGADQRAAHRCARRHPSVGQYLPAYAGQHLRCRGRGGRQDRRCAQGNLVAGRGRCSQQRADQEPGCVRCVPAGERLRDQALSTANFKLLPKAVAAFRQAVDHDPAFAQAWAKLAGSQSLLVYTSIDSSEAICRQSLANARHALALAPDLPLGHLVLGYAYRFCLADYDGALDQFRIARKGLPNNADVEAAIAYIDWIKGDKRAVVAGLQRAVSLDPRSPDRTMYLAQAWEALGRYERARASFNRALALAPEDPEIWSGLAYLAALQHGDVEAARGALDRAPAALQSESQIVWTRVELLLLKRDYAAAHDAVRQLKPGGRDITPMRVAMLRAEVDRLSGDTRGAKAKYRQALSLARQSPGAKSSETAMFVQSLLPSIYAGLGQRDEALQALGDMLRMARDNGSNYDDLAELKRARIRVLLGDDAAAIAPLDAALAAPLRNSISVPLLKIDPFWDPIRKDPRFQALLSKYAHRLPDQARQGAADD